MSAALLAGMLAIVPGAAPAVEQTDLIVFDVVLKGIRAGRLTLTGTVEGTHYSANGTLESAGLIRLVRKVKYVAESEGTTKNGRYTPSYYSEVADTGKRVSESTMEYRAGVPQVKVYNPPREPQQTDVKPETQGGTVDPLTALYATLRDVPVAEACTLEVQMFDGKRRSQITLSKPVVADDGIVCAGEYRRLAGFSENEMADKVAFPFRLYYVPVGDGRMRVNLIETDTTFGVGSLRRR
ncbi:DUF3108 domain-containing protein [Phaeovulum sp.]|uniref:DUF3108 domain-containing protein n=1 Tax=Phaeovulum sp. TaxID=2934796 RepID=UPI003564F783